MKTSLLVFTGFVVLLTALTVGPRPLVIRTSTVDTVRVVTTVYDTVTVTSRAADTVRVVIKQVGPLTEQDVVRLVCGHQGFTYGDKRDRFGFNTYGMVFCPKGDSQGRE